MPDFTDAIKQISDREKKRSHSAVYDNTFRDIERRLILINRPFMPKFIKHTKFRSENASEVSEEMNEEKYYKELKGRIYSEDDADEDVICGL